MKHRGVDMGAVLFIENKKDIEKAEEVKKKSGCLIISLDPEVSYALEKREIPFKVQDDYFSSYECLNLGLENFDKVKKFCRFCDEFLRDRIGFLKENKLTFAFYHYYCFKILFDVISSKIFVLKKIMQEEKPAKICFFDDGKRETVDETLFFKGTSPYNEVLKILCGFYKIDCEIFDSPETGGAQTQAAAEPQCAGNVNILSGIYRIFKKIYDNLFGGRGKLPVVFMTSPAYDLSHIAGLIRKEKKARILCFDPESGKKPHFIYPPREKLKTIDYDKTISENINYREIWADLSKDKIFRGFFVFGNIDAFPIVSRRLEYFFTVFVKNLINLYLYGFELFKSYKPKAFFAPFIIRAKMHTLAQAARNNNIPLIVYQHGGIYGYSDCKMNNELDFQYCDYYISFGEGVRRRFINSRAEVIPVGSFVLNNLKRSVTAKNKIKIKKTLGINRNKKVVIYVMNPLYRNWNYIDYPYYTDNECFGVQKKIIETFSKYGDYQYILKVFPLYNEKDPIIPYINDRKDKNLKVIHNIFFKALLPCADLIIVDAVSQPLVEALTTKQKIMVYDLFKGTFPDAVEALRKRAYYSTDIDEYTAKLCEVLEKGDFSAESADNEFSRLYGNYEDYDGMNGDLKIFLNKFIAKEEVLNL